MSSLTMQMLDSNVSFSYIPLGLPYIHIRLAPQFLIDDGKEGM
jgi:hypothetical protein